jgi:hypothetical protein
MRPFLMTRGQMMLSSQTSWLRPPTKHVLNNSKRWNKMCGWQVWLWHTWVPWSVDIYYVHLHCLRLASEASLTDNSMYLDLIFNLSTVGYWSTWDQVHIEYTPYCLLSFERSYYSYVVPNARYGTAGKIKTQSLQKPADCINLHVRLSLSAWLISRGTVFFSHSKSATADL